MIFLPITAQTLTGWGFKLGVVHLHRGNFSLDEKAAQIAGHIRAQLAALGTPIGPYDVQIAAIALANDLILVTHNTGEFSRVNGLRIEDWEGVG